DPVDDEDGRQLNREVNEIGGVSQVAELREPLETRAQGLVDQGESRQAAEGEDNHGSAAEPGRADRDDPRDAEPEGDPALCPVELLDQANHRAADKEIFDADEE